MPSLTVQAAQSSGSCDIFISYASQDSDCATELESCIRNAGALPWLDKRQVRTGEQFPQSLAAALRSSAVVAWLASPVSVASPWVRRELYYAAVKLNKLIVPIFLDEALKTSLPDDLQFFVAGTEYVDASSDWRSAIRQAAPDLKRVADIVKQPPPHKTETNTNEFARPGGRVSLLPVSESSPMIIGLAIDVSGTMSELMPNADAMATSRLNSVLQGVREVVCKYAHTTADDVRAVFSLIRVFAYGFGFNDTAAQYGRAIKLLGRFSRDIPALPDQIFHGPVRDLFSIAGLQNKALVLSQLESDWDRISSALWAQKLDLFGSTPMRRALEIIDARFDEEFAAFAGRPHSALVIVSDGKSSDGSPVEPSLRIARRGTTVLSCYLTSTDVLEPKRLYAEPEPSWPAGAIDLFYSASILQEEDSLLIGALRSKEWAVQEGCRLFVQVNQSELVGEFLRFLLDLTRNQIC